MEFCNNNIFIIYQVFTIIRRCMLSAYSPQKITYLAQVAQMFTLNGFLCTGETDFFPETKKKKKMLKFYTNYMHL